MLLELSGVANNYIEVAYWKDCSDNNVKMHLSLRVILEEDSELRAWTF